jgi:hypothetical protein
MPAIAEGPSLPLALKPSAPHDQGMDGASLYDADIVAWAEQQADAVRTLARNRPDLSNVLDFENIAEELECLGRTELKSVTSPLRNVFIHLLKAYCDSSSLSMNQWGNETDNWLADIREEFTPSMRQKVDVDELWKHAATRAARQLTRYGVAMPPGIPAGCPFTLDEILQEDFTFDKAWRQLHTLLTSRS